MLRNSSSSSNVAAASAKKHYPTSAADYEVLDVVGQGVSAKVFRALCRPLNEIVAVKTIELEVMNTNLEEIMREAKTMRMAQHPNILNLYCSFVTKENVLWMVMPYVGGGSVLSIMKWAYRDGLEESWIASILCEVLKSVDYMHKHNFIHRDIKAGNILIDLDGHVKLGDFGVAATMERSGSWGRSGGNTRQTFVGTPCWMAPEVMEQIEGYDWHADIWSFGITMLELAHGHAPFAKYPPMKVLLMTLQNEPPKLEESYKQRHFSKAMREVVQLCLQKDPKKRPTAAKLLEHRLFKGAHHDKDYLVKHLLKGLPSLVERVHNLSNTAHKGEVQKTAAGAGADVSKFAAQQEMETKSQNAYVKGVSAWDFDVNELKMDAANETTAAVGQGACADDSRPVGKPPLSIQAPGAGPGSGAPMQVTSPLSIKQKTPAAHKGRFKINLEDDDDAIMESPPNDAALAMKRHLGKTTGGDPSAGISRAAAPAPKDPLPAVKKKEQRGRFFISGENDDEKEEDDRPEPTKKAQGSSQPSAPVKLDGPAGDSHHVEPAAGVAKAKDLAGQSRGGGADASVPPQVAQYLQAMQSSMQQQQETLAYLMGGLRIGGQKMAGGSILQSPRPHSLNESGQHHTQLIKAADEMSSQVRALCEENDKLKKRNLHLERELTKCQNKLLELQEAKEKEEEEEQMKELERVSSQVIIDRDNARHLASANRSASEKSLNKDGH